jgi:hypothetical protein
MAATNLNFDQSYLNIDANQPYVYRSKEIKFKLVHFPQDQMIEVVCTQDDSEHIEAKKSFQADVVSGSLIGQFMQEMVQKLCGTGTSLTRQMWTYQQPIQQPIQQEINPQINAVVDGVINNFIVQKDNPTANHSMESDNNNPKSVSAPHVKDLPPQIQGSFECTAETFYDFFGPIFARFLNNVTKCEKNSLRGHDNHKSILV